MVVGAAKGGDAMTWQMAVPKDMTPEAFALSLQTIVQAIGGQMNFELCPWDDGTMRLIYWDHVAGKDAVFVLHEDGTASQARYVDEDAEIETFTPVELVTVLRGMWAAMRGEDSAQEAK